MAGPAPSAARQATHRPRAWGVLAAAGLVLALGWLVVTSLARPMRVTCDPTMSAGSCAESVAGALSRGLPRPHGLLLAAHVAPGPDRDAGELGHRATVTFDVLGAPAPVGVALYLDMGGHWGGVLDRDRLEVAAVPVVQSVLIVMLGLGIAWLIRSGVGRGRTRPDGMEREEAGSCNERT